MSKGLDLEPLLYDLPADRAFNLIDSILIDDLVFLARDEEAIAKLRGKWNQIYDRVDFSNLEDQMSTSTEYYDGEEEKPEGYIPGNYIVPNEDGYPGLRERPMG